jgi:[ribosomal protein S5]-alanine N-acetyltransferase
MIKGYPSVSGEVIIGYGTNNAYQNRGYMTEAVEGLVKWIFTNPKAVSIFADTDKTNVASHRVLIKNGFVNCKETSRTSEDGKLEEFVWWRLDKAMDI